MIRLILPAIIAGTLASAEEMACLAQPDSPDSCLVIIGCIEQPRFFKEDLTFTGQISGWNSGTVALTLSNEVTCAGTWVASRTEPKGTAAIICADGMGLMIDDVSDDREDEVIEINGYDDTGRTIRAWTDRSGSIATLREKTVRERQTNIRTCTFKDEFPALRK